VPPGGSLDDAQILDLVRRSEVSLPPFAVSPSRRRAPLEVEIEWQAARVATVEHDLDGDGRFEQSVPLDPERAVPNRLDSRQGLSP
jgi:hypothetical protein